VPARPCDHHIRLLDVSEAARGARAADLAIERRSTYLMGQGEMLVDTSTAFDD
jgi:hypothetical protein